MSSLIDSTLQATNEDIFQASNLYPSVNSILASLCDHVRVCVCVLPVPDIRQVKNRLSFKK